MSSSSTGKKNQAQWARNLILAHCASPFNNDSLPNLFHSSIPSPIPKLTWTWKKDADDKDHKDDYAVSYRSFLDQVGFTGRNLGCGVTWKDYRTHRFLIAYSNSAVGLSASTDPYRERNMRGDVSCNLKFQDELTQDLVLIAFAITDDVYAIDKDRKMVINPPMY